MTPPKVPENRRSNQQHGRYAIENALRNIDDHEAWLNNLGEVGVELKAWRAAIINDLGGESAISSMERAIVELAVKTYLMLQSVDKFMLEQDSLVNKCKRQLFPVVLQRQQLADALARYMAQLGLKRRVKAAPSLAEYLRMKGHKQDDTETDEGQTDDDPEERDGRTTNAAV